MVEHVVPVLFAFLQRDAREGDRQARRSYVDVVLLAAAPSCAVVEPPLHLVRIVEIASSAFWNSTAEGVGCSQAARSDMARDATRLFANQNVSRMTSARRDDPARADTASEMAIDDGEVGEVHATSNHAARAGSPASASALARQRERQRRRRSSRAAARGRARRRRRAPCRSASRRRLTPRLSELPQRALLALAGERRERHQHDEQRQEHLQRLGGRSSRRSAAPRCGPGRAGT